jgi:hypothetical protein
MTTGDRVWANPDGNGLRVMEVLGVLPGDVLGTLWDGETIHGPTPLGRHRIAEVHYNRYPVGQRFGDD